MMFILMFICLQSACFFTGSSTDGFYKTCYYDCPMGSMSIVVDATAMCPAVL